MNSNTTSDGWYCIYPADCPCTSTSRQVEGQSCEGALDEFFDTNTSCNSSTHIFIRRSAAVFPLGRRSEPWRHTRTIFHNPGLLSGWRKGEPFSPAYASYAAYDPAPFSCAVCGLVLRVHPIHQIWVQLRLLYSRRQILALFAPTQLNSALTGHRTALAALLHRRILTLGDLLRRCLAVRASTLLDPVRDYTRASADCFFFPLPQFTAENQKVY